VKNGSTKPASWETVYGKVAFWTALLGAAVACIGAAWHLGGSGALVSPGETIGRLWAGESPRTIWREAGKEFVTRPWWYVRHPGFPEAVCLIGMSITALAAAAGVWAAAAVMALSGAERKKPAYRLYLLLAVVIALLLTLNAAGLLLP